MADLRQILAAVLGVGIGLVFVLAPRFVVSIHLMGRGPHDRHGDVGSADMDTKWLRLVQGVGVLLLLGGAYFAYTVLG